MDTTNSAMERQLHGTHRHKLLPLVMADRQSLLTQGGTTRAPFWMMAPSPVGAGTTMPKLEMAARLGSFGLSSYPLGLGRTAVDISLGRGIPVPSWMMVRSFVGGTMPTDYWAMEPPCRDTRQPRRNPSAIIGLLCPFLQITGTHAQYWMTAQSRAGAMVDLAG